MKSKIFAIWMCAMLMFSGAVVMAGNGVNAEKETVEILGGGTFGGGDGSIGTPYIIEDALDLQAMNTGTSSHYILGNDIDASDTMNWNAGAGFIPCPNFWGSLNGAGYTIRDLTVNSSTGFEDIGLFGYLNSGSSVSNLNLVDCTISGRGQGHYAGMIAGVSYGTITNCSANGNVMTYNLGGGSHAGGLAGYVDTGCIISNSSSTGTVSGSDYAGGLAGRAYGTISNCYSTSIVVGNASGYRSGGFIGENGGPVTNCYSTGSASTGPFGVVGGFIGVNSGTATGCYWDTQTSGLPTSAGGTGRITAQMKTQSTFAGWDFATIWHMKSGVTYPLSQNEPLPAFSGGDGSATNPYIITNVWELQNMTLELGANYTIANDFDAGISATWNGGQGFNPIGNATMVTFNGSLDGKNHTISNLFINRTGGLKGMFGTISSVGRVTNLTMLGFNITGTGNYVGGLAGVNKGTVRWVSCQADVRASSNAGGLLGTNDPSSYLSDCHSSGSVTTAFDRAGGLIGYTNGHVRNCSSSANVTAGTHYAGGLIGTCTGASLEVTGCHASGSVTSAMYAGGLIGQNTDCTISYCSASGNVNSTGLGVVGGFVGTNGGSITGCSAFGDVFGYGHVGGLTGDNDGQISQSDAHGTVTAPSSDVAGGLVAYNEGDIDRCVSSGNVSGRDNIGGLVGSNILAEISNCTATGTVNGEDTVGGLVGYNDPNGWINNSHSEGTVAGTGNAVGGLVGHCSGNLTRSSAFSNVTGGTKVGGLVGIAGTVANCYATGSVSGTDKVGGAAGESWSPVTNCYSTGAVSGTTLVGGFMGENTFMGSVTNCFYDQNTSGQSDMGQGTPRTTNQMMQQTTFPTWDFTNIWDIKETFTYPFFIWNQFNSVPVAQDDQFTVDEDSIRGGNVTLDNGLGPDIDPDGGPLTVTEMNGNAGAISMSTMIPSGAWVTLWPNGTFTYIPAFANQALAPGQWVHDTFTYTVRDANMTTDTATVTVNVTGLNDAPVMANAGDSVNFNEDGPGVIIDPDITVSDVDNANLVGAWVNITANYESGWDLLEFAGLGAITSTYTAPNLHLTGLDTVANYTAALRDVRFNNTSQNPDWSPRTITWMVTDGLLWSGATSTVTVTAFNDPPQAVNDTGAGFTTDEDTAFDTADVTLNDTDPEYDGLDVTSFDDTGTTGIVADNGDNTFNYDPNGQFDYLAVGEFAADTFTYTVTDGNGGTDTATVTITVNGANDAPTAVDDGGPGFVTSETSAFDTANVLANDTDPDTSDVLSVDSFDDTGTMGLVADNGDGTFNYDPNGQFEYLAVGESDTDSFTYTVTDGNGGFDTAMVTITITGGNGAPTANNDSGAGFTTDEDTAFDTANALANDNDPDTSDVLSVDSLDDTGTIGVVTDNGDGTFNYDPNGQFDYLAVGESATDAFTYTVTDGHGGFDTAVVTITITGVNDAPVLDPVGNRTVAEGSLLSFTATASDIELDGLTFSLGSGAPAGAAITAGGDFTWTPIEDQGPGLYDIAIIVTDDGTPNQNDTEVIFVTVTEVNTAPVLTAIGDKAVNELVSLTFTATATDADIPVNTLTYSLDAGAPTGAGINPISGLFTWTPTEAQGPGTYSVTIRVTDDGGLDDFETIQITVGEVNVAPVLGVLPDRVVDELTLRTFTATATDADLPANVLTFSLEAGAPAGAAITAGGAFSWRPTEAQGPGVYNITVRVTDADGLFDNGTFTVTVNEVNAAPVANNDAFTVNEDSGANALDVLANDMDPDIPANTLTIIAVTQGTHGTVVITGSGTGLTYRPNADFFGTDSFTYTITDGNGENVTATVAITVLNVNDDPTAVDDAITINEDSGPVSIPVLANDYCAPDVGETLTIGTVTQGAHGTVVITGGGTGLTYRPDDNYHGTDTFTYTISDGNGGSATATVTVTVTPVNDAPVITNSDVKTAIEGDEYSVAYSATDVDGDALTWSLDTNAAWLTMNPATGLLNGTAVAGTYNVKITVSDGTDWVVRFFKLTVYHRDSDGDGVPDYLDDFPDDPNEWKDTDGDGIGDNSDPDIDGDGVPNDQDAFPYDPTEWKDTDGDGIGDNSDPDIDGDGVPNEEDPKPLDAKVTGNEYDTGWPYWYVVITIGMSALLGLIGLAVFRFLVKN